MNADGEGQSRLTASDSDPSDPAGLFFQVEPSWSPDGSRIAFASQRSGNFDIYVMNADGTDTRKVTSTKQNDSHPTWSSSGQTLAFARDGDVYTMSEDGSQRDTHLGSSRGGVRSGLVPRRHMDRLCPPDSRYARPRDLAHAPERLPAARRHLAGRARLHAGVVARQLPNRLLEQCRQRRVRTLRSRCRREGAAERCSDRRRQLRAVVVSRTDRRSPTRRTARSSPSSSAAARSKG